MSTYFGPAVLTVCVALSLPALAQQNLLQNPGFEDAADGGAAPWAPSCTGGSIAERVTGQGAQGEACGHIVKVNDGQSHVAAFAQDVAVTGATEYLLTGLARANVRPGTAMLFCYEYGQNDTWVRVAPGTAVRSEDFQALSVRFRTEPQTVRCQVRFEIYGETSEGEAWVDDVYFGPPVEPLPAPTNLSAHLQGEQVRIEWDPPAEDRVWLYGLYRSPFPDVAPSPGNLVALADGPAWDEPLPARPRCYYRVTAIDTVHQEGAPSEVLRADLPAAGDEPRTVIWTQPTVAKTRRFVAPPAGQAPSSLDIEVAGNEVEAGQLLVSAMARPLQGVSVAVSPLRSPEGSRLPEGAAKLFRVGYTNVPRPTIPGATPGLYPDPLIPLTGPFEVPLDATQAVWVQLTVPPDCAPGTYTGEVRLAWDGDQATVPLRVTVFDFSLPAENSSMSAYGLWGNFIAQAHGVRMGSEEYQRLFDRYYWFMVEHRVLPRELPVDVMSDEAARYLDDPRVNSFAIPAGWTQVDVESLRRVVARLRERDWLRKGYVYAYDEPTPEQYETCRELAATVHEVGRDVPFLLTEQPEEALYGAVDIWCPVLSAIDWPRMEERRAAGKRLWWYTCCGPQAPYPTYLVDDVGLSHRVLSWLQALHRIEGVLYWAVTVWAPYRDGAYSDEIVVWDQAEVFPGANGDGFLLYPGGAVGIDGPVSSMRLEIIRDGNEDFEYLALLRRLLVASGAADPDAQIERLIQPVAREFTDWTRDPETLLSQRRRVAEEIIRLQQGT